MHPGHSLDLNLNYYYYYYLCYVVGVHWSNWIVMGSGELLCSYLPIYLFDYISV